MATSSTGEFPRVAPDANGLTLGDSMGRIGPAEGLAAAFSWDESKWYMTLGWVSKGRISRREVKGRVSQAVSPPPPEGVPGVAASADCAGV